MQSGSILKVRPPLYKGEGLTDVIWFVRLHGLGHAHRCQQYGKSDYEIYTVVYILFCKRCRTTKFDDNGFTYTHCKQDSIYVFPEMKLRPILSLHYLLECFQA